jgi:hypothetical protein
VAIQIITSSKGLSTAGTDLAAPGQGGLARADNVVFSRDSLWQPRRGIAQQGVSIAGKTLDYIGTFKERYVLHATDGSAYIWDGETTAAPTLLAGGPYLPPTGGVFRTLESNNDLFLSYTGGLKRLDSYTGTPLPAGAPPALDATGVAGTATGTALPGDSQVAYRTVFGIRDANNRLILGAPGGRAVVVSPSIIAPAGTAVRTTNVVRVTYANHPFVLGEKVVISGGDSVIANGTYTVSAVATNTFDFASTAADGSNSLALTINRDTRDVTVSASIPSAASTGGYFYQVYRSASSASADISPSDEMGLVIEAAVPSAVALANLARTGSTATANTATPHNFTAGVSINLPDGLAGSSARVAAIGANIAYNSANSGSSWSTSTLPSGTFNALAWNGSIFAAVGANIAASSTDGITFTSRTAAPTGKTWNSVAWGGGVASTFCAVAPGVHGVHQNVSGLSVVTFEGLSSSKTKTFTNVSPGADVSGAYTISNQHPTQSRSAVCTGKYRVDGGAWQTMWSVTQTCPADSGETASCGPYTLPTSGVIDLLITITANGSAWDDQTTVDGHEPGSQFNTAVYDLFVSGSASSCMTSPDGLAWTQQTNLPYAPANDFVARLVTYDGSKFVVLGTGTDTLAGSVKVMAATSMLGTTWSLGAANGLSATYNAIASNGAGRCVAVGDAGAAYTDDGTTWTAITGMPAGAWKGIAWWPLASRWVAVGTNCAATSTDGVTWTSRTIPTGNWQAVGIDGTVAVAVGVNVGATTTDGITWTSHNPGTGDFRAVAASPVTGIKAGTYVIASVGPSATEFTFSTAPDSGGLSLTNTTQVATPVTIGVIDSVSDTMLGQAAYWNTSQEGYASVHDQPPSCLDLAQYRNYTFFAAPTRPPVVMVNLLNCGGSTGLAVDDVITLPGGSITAKATESVTALQFKVFSTGNAGLDTNSTVESICRVINRNPGLGVYAVQTSTSDSTSPGTFALVSYSPTSPASVSFSNHKTAWSPSQGQTVQPVRELNLLAYSLIDRPDAAPTLNSLRVGRSDKAILRVVPLRDCLIIIKEDGIWKLTGFIDTQFQVSPLDLTTRVVAPNSVAVLANVIIALASTGFVAITDQGVQPISLDITDQLEPLLAPSMLATTKAVCVGMAYQSDNSYTMWAPSSPSDTVPTRGWTYNALTQQWTGRTDGFSAATVSPVDDRIWAVKDAQVYRERKAFDRTDFADLTLHVDLTASAQVGVNLYLSTTVGIEEGDLILQGSVWANVVSTGAGYVTLDRNVAFTTGTADISVLKGIPVHIEWSPTYGSPGSRIHARETGAIFQHASFSTASMAYASDMATTASTVPLVGSSLGLDREPAGSLHRTIRALVPREQQRCSQLTVSFATASAWSDWALEAMQVVYEGGTERVSK